MQIFKFFLNNHGRSLGRRSYRVAWGFNAWITDKKCRSKPGCHWQLKDWAMVREFWLAEIEINFKWKQETKVLSLRIEDARFMLLAWGAWAKNIVSAISLNCKGVCNWVAFDSPAPCFWFSSPQLEMRVTRLLNHHRLLAIFHYHHRVFFFFRFFFQGFLSFLENIWCKLNGKYDSLK